MNAFIDCVTIHFAVNLDKCMVSCNTVNDLSNTVSVPSKIKDLIWFNMIKGINESKTLKQISCKCKYRLNDRKCNSNQTWNNNKWRCECKSLKERHICKIDYIWNTAAWTYKNGKYLASIINNSVIMYDQIISIVDSVTTNVPKNFIRTVSMNVGNQ